MQEYSVLHLHSAQACDSTEKNGVHTKTFCKLSQLFTSSLKVVKKIQDLTQSFFHDLASTGVTRL